MLKFESADIALAYPWIVRAPWGQAVKLPTLQDARLVSFIDRFVSCWLRGCHEDYFATECSKARQSRRYS
jgi:hypothetical protein